MDLIGFVHGAGAHVDADGITRLGGRVWDVDGRKATSYSLGWGPSFDCWVDEIPLLEADAVMYGNVYLSKSATSVCSRIDPSRITPAP